MEATKTKTKTTTSNLSSTASLAHVPRVSRTDLRKRLVQALREDGLVTLCADSGYGAKSLAREVAAYLKAHKHRVMLYNFSSVASKEISTSLKALLQRVETKKKAFLFLLDFPAPHENEITKALDTLKKLQKCARLCIVGSSRLVLFNEMLQNHLRAHATFFAQDLLVGEDEYKYFALGDEETYQEFLRATNGVVSLAENRYQTASGARKTKDNSGPARKSARTRKASAKNGSNNESLRISTHTAGAKHAKAEVLSSASLLVTSVQRTELREEQQLRCALALLRNGSAADLKEVGLKIAPETLAELARDAPIFGTKVPLNSSPSEERTGLWGDDSGACTCQSSSFGLPQTITCPVEIAQFCLEEFEDIFFAVTTKLLNGEGATQAYAFLKATARHRKVQRYILEHASILYEKGGADLLFQVGAFLEERGKALSRSESEFLKIARALSKKRTRRWLLESCINAELLTSSEAGKRAHLQHLILLYEVAHQYKSVRQSMCVASDSYASLEHYDAALPHELRSLASFLFIRRAFLQNDLERAARRAEIARVDCNHTSFSGALLTLALFEVDLFETVPSANDVFPGNLDEIPFEVKSALEFLDRPGYETVYKYERCFLELFLNFVGSDRLASGVRELQCISVKNKDDVMVTVTLCARAYNNLLSGHPQRSLGAIEEAGFLAKKTHIPLLEEIASVLEEALKPAQALKKTEDMDGKIQEDQECEAQALYGPAAKGPATNGVSGRAHVLTIGSTPELIRFILCQTKRKMLLKREVSFSEGVSLDELPPSIVAVPFVLNGLWAGILHLIIEKVEDVGAELFPELPSQWRNVLVEKSRSFKRRQKMRASQKDAGYASSLEGAIKHTGHSLSTLSFEPASFGFLAAHGRRSLSTYASNARSDEASSAGERPGFLTYPTLRISLLDKFSIRLGDMSLPDTAWRRESSKNLLILLAAAAGHTLSRQVLFRKLWPNLDYLAHANNLYTALSDLRKVLTIRDNQKRRNVPYIISRHGMLSLNTQIVDVDVDALFSATKKVGHPATSDSVKRMNALELLILFGRGPKFPRGFSQMSEAEYLKNQLAREFAGASIEGALAAWRMGYFRDATKLALAAVAASQLQEDIVADALKLLIDMGKTEEVHRIYRVFQNHYKKLYGTEPEGEIKRLYQALVSRRKAPPTVMVSSSAKEEMKLVA